MYRFYSKGDATPSKKTKRVYPVPTHRVTIVGEVEQDTLKLAVARCSHRDKFVRKVGRQIAEGRLKKGNIFMYVPLTEGQLTTEKFIEIASAVAQELLSIPGEEKVEETKASAELV